MERTIAPIFFLTIGVLFLLLSFNLQQASIGNPNELKYFPIMVSVMIIVFSIIYLLKEWRLRKIKFESFELIKVPKTIKRLGLTIIYMFIYTIILEKIGFLLSTMIFLGLLLFLINGKKKWKINIIITILFSVITWYSFGTLLQVSLP